MSFLIRSQVKKVSKMAHKTNTFSQLFFKRSTVIYKHICKITQPLFVFNLPAAAFSLGMLKHSQGSVYLPPGLIQEPCLLMTHKILKDDICMSL